MCLHSFLKKGRCWCFVCVWSISDH